MSIRAIIMLYTKGMRNMNKIFEKLNSISKFSKKVILFGAVLSAVLCLIGFSIVTYNKTVIQTISLYTIGTSLIYASIVLFSEFTIGGLAMELAGTVIKNHMD